MILVFTGNGKGKTTAAIGQAVRAVGQGKKVIIIKFIKGPWISGEDTFNSKFQSKNKEYLKEKFGRLNIVRTGLGFVGILGDKLPFREHKKAAQTGIELFKKTLDSQKYDLIVLDEINNAVDLKLVKASEVLKVIGEFSRKHPRRFDSLDIILTGRNAPESFIRISDIATEMKEVKHVYNKGTLAKKGAEY